MAITVLQGVANNASTLHPDCARLLEPKTRPGNENNKKIIPRCLVGKAKKNQTLGDVGSL
jgi:hypothetical protein